MLCFLFMLTGGCGPGTIRHSQTCIWHLIYNANLTVLYAMEEHLCRLELQQGMWRPCPAVVIAGATPCSFRRHPVAGAPSSAASPGGTFVHGSL